MLRLQFEREKRGLTQKDLSLKVGINRVFISNLESGQMKPFPGWEKRLEKFFKMPIGELLETIEIRDKSGRVISEKELFQKAEELFKNLLAFGLYRDPEAEAFLKKIGVKDHDDCEQVLAEIMHYYKAAVSVSY
jgi:transcriptional regulator with XRE-family HTH domain